MIISEESSHSMVQNNEINVRELITILWDKKFLISCITTLFAVTAIIYSLSLPNVYESRALLAPANDSDSSMGMLQQYSSVANLAGISIGSDGAKDKSLEAIARINSFDFFSEFVLPEIALKDLMASKKWSSSSDLIEYDNKIFNSSKNIWVENIPSAQEAFARYKQIMSISQDKKTQFVNISITHKSPYIAKDWVSIIVKNINMSMRDNEKNKVKKSIDFLNNQAMAVKYEEVKQSISALQQEQIKSLMLIEASEEYIFKSISTPIAPEFKSGPARSALVIAVTLLGLIFSFITVLINHFNNKLKNKI